MNRWISTQFTSPLNGQDVYYFVENEGVFLGKYNNRSFYGSTYNFDIKKVSS